jgi:hypothetical protein
LLLFSVVVLNWTAPLKITPSGIRFGRTIGVSGIVSRMLAAGFLGT